MKESLIKKKINHIVAIIESRCLTRDLWWWESSGCKSPNFFHNNHPLIILVNPHFFLDMIIIFWQPRNLYYLSIKKKTGKEMINIILYYMNINIMIDWLVYQPAAHDNNMIWMNEWTWTFPQSWKYTCWRRCDSLESYYYCY